MVHSRTRPRGMELGICTRVKARGTLGQGLINGLF